MNKIKKIDNIKIFHLKVICDPKTHKLEFDRKLEEGSGPATYGLEVCKAMDLPKEFLDEAYNTRRDIMGLNNDILPELPSKYNSEVYIHICEVCGEKGDDIHHIEFQCLANKNNLIGNIHKNAKFNLG